MLESFPLCSRKSLYIVGRSGGGSAAGHFAASYPKMVRALFLEAPRDLPGATDINGEYPLCLLAFGEFDTVSPQCRLFEKAMKDNSVDSFCVIFRPQWSRRGDFLWQHCMDEPTKNFAVSWITGVADLAIANGGVIPKMRDWPVTKQGELFPTLDSANNWLLTCGRIRAVSTRMDVYEVFPKRNEEYKGTVIIIGDGRLPEFARDDDFHIAQYVADQGRRVAICYVDIGDNGSRLQSQLQGLVSNTGGVNEGGVFLGRVGSTRLVDILKANQKLFAHSRVLDLSMSLNSQSIIAGIPEGISYGFGLSEGGFGALKMAKAPRVNTRSPIIQDLYQSYAIIKDFINE